MDIRLMHIQFHALRQKKLGNDYTHLTDEAVDDTLNMVIEDTTRIKSSDEEVQEGQTNGLTERYYQGLETLIRTVNITQLQPYAFNPSGRVVDLDSIGKTVGNRFSAVGTLKSGNLYRIVTFNTGDDFSNVGAYNEQAFTFTAKGVAQYQPINRTAGYVIRNSQGLYITDTRDLEAGVSYTVLEGSLTYALADITTEGITVDGVTRIPNVNLIQNLVIDKDSTFIVHNNLTPSAWTNCSILENLSDGDIYYKFISSSATVDYSTGSTPASKIVKCRLYKARNIETILNHSRGSVISSPVSHIEGRKLVVYQNKDVRGVPVNEKFIILNVSVRYYKKPNVVSLTRNINCDLEEIDHPMIVRNAVELSTAASATQNFQTLASENAKLNVNK